MVDEALSHDEKDKKTLVEPSKQVPLSARTAIRRAEVLVEQYFSNLLTDWKKAEAISLATGFPCE